MGEREVRGGMSYKITRKVASRRLKRRCKYCNIGFIKGNVYYLYREVSGYDGKVYAYEHLECAKCNFKRKDWKRRYEKFRGKCVHPNEFVVEHWGYIPGEAVKQPEYDVCTLCGTKL